MSDEPKSWKQMKTELLEDGATRAAYDEIEERMRLVRAVVVARTKRVWSQRDLAEAAGLKQPAIARFERASSDPQLGTVTKILNALDLRLVIDDDGIAGAKPQKRRAAAAKSTRARGGRLVGT